MKSYQELATLSLVLGAALLPAYAAEPTTSTPGSSGAIQSMHRSHLPMPNTVRQSLVTDDAKSPDTKFPPIEQLRPPKGAPNVLIVLIDDAGFGASSAFGGLCQTPILEKLAPGGLKYDRFHTTALCSPTRQALLTGRNHHSAGMGNITELAPGAPGYCSQFPNSIAAGAHARAQRLRHRGSSASATKFRFGRPAPRGRTIPGPRAAVGSSTSMASSAVRQTNGIRRSTRARRRSN